MWQPPFTPSVASPLVNALPPVQWSPPGAALEGARARRPLWSAASSSSRSLADSEASGGAATLPPPQLVGPLPFQPAEELDGWCV